MAERLLQLDNLLNIHTVDDINLSSRQSAGSTEISPNCGNYQR
jgi:hypothetical protein